MAELVVDVRPGERSAFRGRVTLGEVAVTLRFRWLPQVSRWVMRMEAADGTVLTPQSMCQAGASVLYDPRNAGAPAGSLQWVGQDTRERTDLGTRLRLVWVQP